MKKFIARTLTFWIPIKSIRKRCRYNIEHFLFLRKKRYRKSIKDLIKILENENNIFATVSICWDFCLYQRPQHIATQISNKDFIFLYAVDNEWKCDIQRNGNILFVDRNIFEFLPNRIANKINMIVPSPNPFFNYKRLMKLTKMGYHIYYDYIDDLHEDISGDIKEQLNTFNNLEKINPTCIISTAKNLYQQMLNRCPKEKVFLIPNGVDIKNFENIPNIVPDDMLDIVSQGKPIIGYYGAMAPWINWDLLNKLAIKCNDYNFVYIGIDYGNSLKNLKIFDNVHFLGPKNYTELPRYAQYFTCCMIPFLEGEIAKSTNPLKLFEYMALQKPTVCTKDLLECYGYDGVFIAENCEDFSEKLKFAIAASKDEKIKNQLSNYAQNNTWEKRATDIIEIFKNYKSQNDFFDYSKMQNKKSFLGIDKKNFISELYSKTYYVLKNIFYIKYENNHKNIKIFGLTMKFKLNAKQICKLNEKVITKRYKNNLKNLKLFARNRKIKACFLVSENSKWKNQSLYDLLEKSENFEPQIIITLLEGVHKGYDFTRNNLDENYNFFKSKGMNVIYGYKDGEYIDLKKFKPDIIFYEQPWENAEIQSPQVTSEFALNYYVPYYINNYEPMSFEYELDFHKALYKYYVLNKWWANKYRKLSKLNNIYGLGNPFLDYFYLNKKNTIPQIKKYVIYAPHYSFFHELNPNPVNYGTFLDNGELILEFAQRHPEQNWVFKPHPGLKNSLYKVWGKDKTDKYYKDWEKVGLGCYDSSYLDLFLDSKLLITDCDSFLLEYFCTSNPIIHIVSEHCNAKVPDFSRKIFNTFYKVTNNEELQEQLENLIINNNDYKKELRIKTLNSSNLIDNYAAQNILDDIKKDLRI